MPESNYGRFFQNIQKIVIYIMLALFIPVMFSVFFIGNNMDYFEGAKADILVPNVLLTLGALAAFGFGMWLLFLGKKIPWGKNTGLYLDLGLVVLFVGFYFFCITLSKETAFDMAVDPGIVREAAKEVAHGVPFGYRYEFSMNHNNLPIIYVLGRLYRWAESFTWGHDPEYLWLIVGNLLVTLAGFCCCEMVKKLTRNPIAVLIAFLLYLVTAGLSPWKNIPYTDSYGILFPVLCMLLYFYSRDCKSVPGRVLLRFLALLAGMAGGFLKPSMYIIVIAVLGMEVCYFLAAAYLWCREREAGVKYAGFSLLISAFFVGILLAGTSRSKEFIIEEMGLDYNEEIEATAQYFFFMGTNETTTGSFSIDDYGVFGEFQFSKADRNAACMERAWERIRERGPTGTLYFCLKKLVKSFNDGTFGWTDVRYYEPFPENFFHNKWIAGYVRSLFIPEGENQALYDTLAELAWIFTLLGIPGIVLAKKQKEHYMFISVAMIGILLYLMLFESGARYVYVFLPIFVAASICGMRLIEKKYREWRTAKEDKR